MIEMMPDKWQTLPMAGKAPEAMIKTEPADWQALSEMEGRRSSRNQLLQDRRRKEKGPKRITEEIERRVRERIEGTRCVDEVLPSDEQQTSDLLLRMTIVEVREETRYDQSMMATNTSTDPTDKLTEALQKLNAQGPSARPRQAAAGQPSAAQPRMAPPPISGIKR